MEPMTDKSFNYIEITYSKVKHTLEWDEAWKERLEISTKLTVDDWLNNWSINISKIDIGRHHIEADAKKGWFIKDHISHIRGAQLVSYKFTEECKDYLRMMLVL